MHNIFKDVGKQMGFTEVIAVILLWEFPVRPLIKWTKRQLAESYKKYDAEQKKKEQADKAEPVSA